MANKFTRFLTDVFTGLSNPKGRVANYTHATRLFIDDNYRLSPKHKYNYYDRYSILFRGKIINIARFLLNTLFFYGFICFFHI